VRIVGRRQISPQPREIFSSCWSSTSEYSSCHSLAFPGEQPSFQLPASRNDKMPPRRRAPVKYEAAQLSDSDGDSDVVERLALPASASAPAPARRSSRRSAPASIAPQAPTNSSTAAAAPKKRASTGKLNGKQKLEDDDDDDALHEDSFEANPAAVAQRSKGKGKAKATSEDEREEAINRATTRNRAQIDADAILAAQLAGGDSDDDVVAIANAQDDDDEDELLEDDDESDDDNSADDYNDEELPPARRRRISRPTKAAPVANGKGKGKAKQAPTRSKAVKSPSSGSPKRRTSVPVSEPPASDDDDDDSDFNLNISDEDVVGVSSDDDDTETLSRPIAKAPRTSKYRSAHIADSVPEDYVFKKPDYSNYIKTPENRGKRLPYVLKEFADTIREEKRRAEAEAAEAAAAAAAAEQKGVAGSSKDVPQSKKAPAKRGRKSATDKAGTAQAGAKGSMQEDQRYETEKQREARLRREQREARAEAAAARRGVKRRFTTHYERNMSKLQAHHPELTSIWEDLAALPIPEPVSATPPSNIAPGVSLLPFQLESLYWLVKQEESAWQGGLLADEMGMGKTVQMISLMLSDAERGKKTDKARGTLVVAPTVAIMQWCNELAKYAPQFKVVLWHGANRATTSQSGELKKADVVLTSYAVLESSFRRQEQGFQRKGEKFTEKSAVHNIEWRRVVLDEAHNIKDRATNTAKGAFALKAVYRWCLSGTPLQNRVGELFSMVRFIGAEPFANYYCLQCDCKSMHWNMVKGKFCASCGHTPMQHTCFWNNEVLKPIQRFGAELGEGKDAFVRLRTLLQHMMLRRTKLERADDMGLPPRTIFVRRDVFNEEEADLYQSLYSDGQRKFTTFIDQGTVLNNYSNIFTLLTRMRQMACHPDLVLRSRTGQAAKLLTDLEETHVCKLCADEAEDPILSNCRHVFCRGCIGEYVGDGEDNGAKLECPYCHAILAIDLEQETMDAPRPEQNARQGMLSRLDLTKWRSSTKIEALVEELSASRSEDHTIKSIVFSQFRSFLDLIALRLARAGFKIARLEGDMTPQQRDRTIKYFSENTSVTVFLISLKAGGVALNLTEASRVYLMDPWWNPSVEMQAADRIHRIGQHRPIIVKRMIIENSIEARIVELQNKKSAMIEAAIGKDDSAMGRLSVADLQFLFQM